MTYGGTVPTINPSFSGFVNSEDAAVLTNAPTCSTTATSTSPVGTYPSTCTGPVGANYSIDPVAGTVTVEPATLKVTGSSPLMTYGAAVPTILPIYEGFVAGDDASKVVTAPTCSTTATSLSPVGFYYTACDGGTVPNYTLSHAQGHAQGLLEIRRKGLSITATDQTKRYGETMTFAGTEFIASGLVNGDTVTSVTLTSRGAAAPAGVTGSPYAIEPKDPVGTGLGNYLVGFTDGKLTVTTAPLMITASSAEMVLLGAVPVITPSYAGFVPGDTAAHLTTQPACATAATSTSPIGTYSSSCLDAVSPNYTISYTAGSVKVTYATTILFDQVRPNRSGSTIPIRIQLFDAAGQNRSSSSIAVTLATRAITPAPGTALQPSGAFTFIATTDRGPMYQYDLKATRFPRGTFTLTYTVAGDPVAHTVRFVIR